MSRRPVLFATAIAVAAMAIGQALASDPAGSAVTAPTDGQPVTVSWTGTLAPGANADSDCTASLDDALNDHHTIDLSVPAGYYDQNGLLAHFRLIPDTPNADIIFTVGVVQGDELVDTHSSDSHGFGGEEGVYLFNPAGAKYDAIGCAFAGGPVPYHASLTLIPNPDTGAPGGFGSDVTPTPAYQQYSPAPGSDEAKADAGEPSIGANWKTGALMYEAGLTTFRITGADSGAPTWTDVSGLATEMLSLDPILATDSVNGRTIVSQLAGTTSFMGYTDSDGVDSSGAPSQAAWTPSPDGGGPSGIDHQTVGVGPYPAGSSFGPLTSYPNAVYYCSQYLSGAFCDRSDDGGLTFNGPRPTYGGECGGLHGHVKVAPDGTVYLPNHDCEGHTGFAYSTDAGETWQVAEVKQSTPGGSDPSVGIASDNTTYLGYIDGTGHPMITRTNDRGTSFSEPVDVGAALGIQNSVFPEVVAGDGGRAAFAFLGTTTPGNYQDADTFGLSPDGKTYTGGEWHLYVATTYDGGNTWATVDATPKDPVQRGSICLLGIGCSGDDRNLLDFNDITIEKNGTVDVAFADGCTGKCVTSTAVADNKHTAVPSFARQTAGWTLFSAYDPATPGKNCGNKNPSPDCQRSKH